MANGFTLLDPLVGMGVVRGVLQGYCRIGNPLRTKRHRIPRSQRIPLGQEAWGRLKFRVQM